MVKLSSTLPSAQVTSFLEDPVSPGGPLDPHPLPLSYRHEDDGGLHYDGDYHGRSRAPGADVDVCFGGRIAVTLIKLL